MKSRERNGRKIDNLCAYVYISDLNTYSLGLHVCVRMFCVCVYKAIYAPQTVAKLQVASVIFALLLKQHLRMVLQRRSPMSQMFCPLPSSPCVRV